MAGAAAVPPLLHLTAQDHSGAVLRLPGRSCSPCPQPRAAPGTAQPGPAAPAGRALVQPCRNPRLGSLLPPICPSLFSLFSVYELGEYRISRSHCHPLPQVLHTKTPSVPGSKFCNWTGSLSLQPLWKQPLFCFWILFIRPKSRAAIQILFFLKSDFTALMKTAYFRGQG